MARQITLLAKPQVADAIIAAVRRGVPPTTAARAAGVSAEAISEWLAIARGQQQGWIVDQVVSPEARAAMSDFSERLAQAEAECEAMMVEQIHDTAYRVNPKTGIPEWRAGAWILNNAPAYRTRYHEHKELHTEGTVTHRIQADLRALPPSELRSLAASTEDPPLELLLSPDPDSPPAAQDG